MGDDLLQSHARTALACLDLTSLGDADTEADIARLCERAQGPHGPVAAVCVWPRLAAFARARLPASIGVAAVANFPEGGVDVERALRDTAAIVIRSWMSPDPISASTSSSVAQRSARSSVASGAATPGRRPVATNSAPVSSVTELDTDIRQSRRHSAASYPVSSRSSRRAPASRSSPSATPPSGISQLYSSSV